MRLFGGIVGLSIRHSLPHKIHGSGIGIVAFLAFAVSEIKRRGKGKFIVGVSRKQRS